MSPDMSPDTARDLLRAFVVEYGEDCTMHTLATDDDDTAHIEARGVAVKSVVASDVDDECAGLFAYSPEIARAYLAEHARAEALEAERTEALWALARANVTMTREDGTRPTVAEGIEVVAADRDRLVRILAVERGDESAAPEWVSGGRDAWWRTFLDGYDYKQIERYDREWLWKVFGDRDSTEPTASGSAPTALEAMEAADAAGGAS